VTPDTVADALAAPFAGTLAVELCGALGVEVVLVTEEEIRDAFRTLYARAKLAVEPGGAAGLAAVLAGRVEGERIAVVVSGGNVSPRIASDILAGR
jgi:threonine dehydratase